MTQAPALCSETVSTSSATLSFAAILNRVWSRVLAGALERGPTAIAVVSIGWSLDGLAVQATSAARAGLCIGTLVAAAMWWRQLASNVAGRCVVSLLALILCLAAMDPWLGTLPAIALSIARFRHAGGWNKPSAHAITLALSLYSMVVLVESTGLLWQEFSRLSWWLTSFVTTVFESPTSQRGYAAADLPSVIFALVVCLSHFVVGRPQVASFVRNTLILIIGLALALAFQQHLLPLLLAGAIAGLTSWPAAPLNKQRSSRPWIPYVLFALASLGLAGYAAGKHSTQVAADRTMGIFETGMHSFTYPGRDELFRVINEANFAALPKVLTASGWTVRTVPGVVTAADLQGISVLTVINLDTALTDGSKQAIEDYVRGGGRLLVLGDHTDIGGIMRPLNDLLSFTDIRFNFDSAIPFDQPTWRWRGCLRGSWHAAMFGRDNHKLGVSVGASLSVGAHARVIAIGDEAFSDIGNPNYGISRLGNMRYDIEEQYGGLPLVAQQRVGNGVVEVWGDTTGFQSTMVTSTFASRIRAINDLVERTPWPVSRIPWVGGMFALIAVGWLVARPIPTHIGFATAIALVLSTGVVRALAVSDKPEIRDASSLVVFDVSHAPESPALVQRSWIDGLSDLSLRCGRVLICHGDIEAMVASRPFAIVISEPAQSYSLQECDRLVEYVEAGGRLFVACGPKGNQRLKGLFERTRLRIDGRTFGSTHRARLVHPDASRVQSPESVVQHKPTQAIDAEPPETFVPYDAEVGFADGHPIVFEAGSNTETLVECWGQPMVIRQVIGRGQLILCGDPRFVTNQVVQHGQDAAKSLEPRNASFLAEFLFD